jgi:adenosine deaminase
MNIADIPKIELHCHLDGIITPQMTSDILQEDPAFPILPEDFADKLPVYDYDSFHRWWTVFEPINGDLNAFKPILQRYIAQLKAQHVDYFEVMIAAGEFPTDTGAAVALLQEFRDWVDTQEAQQIQVEFLIALNRTKNAEVMEQRANIVLHLHEANLICGIAFVGPEANYPVKPHHKMFARFHEAGLGIEIHAGEWVGSESVWDAIEYGYPDRIGHGTSLFKDQKLIDLFLEKQIHLEICPTSNLKTGSVDQIENHPIRLARDLGLNFSISTDDPGVFECSMNSEYELVANTFGFTEADFRKIYQNGLEARFQKKLRIMP